MMRMKVLRMAGEKKPETGVSGTGEVDLGFGHDSTQGYCSARVLDIGTLEVMCTSSSRFDTIPRAMLYASKTTLRLHHHVSPLPPTVLQLSSLLQEAPL